MDLDEAGVPEGQTPETTPDPGSPDTSVDDPQPSEFRVPEKFLDANGNPRWEDLGRAYVNVESELGRVRNEVGELRPLAETAQKYEAWIRGEDGIVITDNETGAWMPRREWEKQRNQPAGPDGQLTPEQLDERLRDEFEQSPSKFLREYGHTVRQEVLQELNQRKTLFSNPNAQKIISEHPVVEARVDELQLQGFSPQDAMKMAVGELHLGGGGQPQPTGPPIPPVNLSHLRTPQRTFIAPAGQTPPVDNPDPSSKLTEGQRAMAKEFGLDPVHVARTGRQE